MSTLTDFLLARIDEDEADARHAAEQEGESWEWDGNPIGGVGENAMSYGIDLRSDVGAHVARWDPARVLVECESKRRIVELHRRVSTENAARPDATGCMVCDWDKDCGIISLFPAGETCETLRLLALPFADRSDFRPEWLV